MERILCAAIWYKDLDMNGKDTPTELYLPRGCDRGIVFCGHRHPHCLYQMVAITGKRQCEVGEEVQGFLTDCNRFVDRKEAAVIAIEFGQIKNLMYSDQTLYSEDLY